MASGQSCSCVEVLVAYCGGSVVGLESKRMLEAKDRDESCYHGHSAGILADSAPAYQALVALLGSAEGQTEGDSGGHLSKRRPRVVNCKV